MKNDEPIRRLMLMANEVPLSTFDYNICNFFKF